jgi:hypothetical protein
MKITEHDATTGETKNRNANAAEIAQLTADQDAQAVLAAEKAAKEAAKAAVLAKLGLTAEELAALI